MTVESVTYDDDAHTDGWLGHEVQKAAPTPMDVVYRYKRTYTSELRYSLRSLRNLPHRRVWVFGERPASFSFSEEVNHVGIRQGAGSKWNNSRRNLRAACEHPDVTDDFVLMDDDFYIMRPIRSVPVLHRGDLYEVVQEYKANDIHSAYTRGLVETAELLRYFGVSKSFDMFAYNLHVPVVVNKAKMLECLDAVERLTPPHMLPLCLHIRTFYGNYWQIGGTQAQDVKLTSSHARIPPYATFVSTSDVALRARVAHRGVRGQLSARFPSASPYER